MNKRTLRKLARPHESWAQTLARVHHEAYLVEAFGKDGSGLHPDEFLALVQAGVLHEPKGPQKPTAFETVFHASDAYSRAPVDEQLQMRAWSADLWRKYLAKHAVDKTAPSVHPKTITQFVQAWPQTPTPPPPPGEMDARQQIKLTAGVLDAVRRRAAEQAVDRAGIFCKRLGELTGGDFAQPTTERWRFDRILDEVDPVLRGNRLKAIRKNVQQALQDGWTPQQLAHALQVDTQDYARDWMRVAVTELQNAWNEGVGIVAVQKYGFDARIARIPETTACAKCLQLFLNADGEPISFLMHTLLKNGNNMNVPRTQWRPTLVALHPRCRCNCTILPPGYKATREGRLISQT